MVCALGLFVALASVSVPAQHHPHPRPHAQAPHAPNHPHAPAKAHARGAAAKARPAADKEATAANKGKAADDVEQVEQVEQVEAVGADAATGNDGGTEAAKAAAADRVPDLATVVGHLHAAVVHLPIAWLALWSFFEALGVLWAHPWLLMSGLPMGVVAVLSFGPAVYTGLARLDELAAASPSYDVGPAHLHRNLLFLAWALCGLACVLRLTAARPGRGFVPRAAYLLLVWIAFAVTGWSAHLGGCMVYGDDFLPF